MACLLVSKELTERGCLCEVLEQVFGHWGTRFVHELDYQTSGAKVHLSFVRSKAIESSGKHDKDF